jgi:hypothetical protein
MPDAGRRLRARVAMAVLVLVSAAIGHPRTTAAQDAAGGDVPTTIELVLGRASWYVYDFVGRYAGVVAEERYVQDSTIPLPSFGLRVGGRGGTTTTSTPSQRVRHRELRSDFLLVKPRASDDWMPFRDVFEVDRIPIRDREDRLAKLFLKPTEDNLEAASLIQEESTRYNLGALKRTINNPVFPLIFLQTENQWRFAFTLARQDRKAGDNVWVVEFAEREKPSLIRGQPGRDMPSHGRFWIDAENGRVMKAEVKVKQPDIDATIVTTFRFDAALKAVVPVEMREEYDMPANRVTGTATYARFRRFQVSADEDIKVPPADGDATPR